MKKKPSTKKKAVECTKYAVITMKPGANRCNACGRPVNGLGQHDCKYVCEKCGHQPCPFCGDWCDVLIGDKPCCNGKCKLVLKKAKK